MFDQMTARSCWAGPAQATTSSASSGEFAEGELTPDEAAELGVGPGGDPKNANPANLPFCEDLK